MNGKGRHTKWRLHESNVLALHDVMPYLDLQIDRDTLGLCTSYLMSQTERIKEHGVNTSWDLYFSVRPVNRSKCPLSIGDDSQRTPIG